MCGIAGIVAPNSKSLSKQLQRMTDAIAHRGPDAEGHYYFDSCGLGHRRLSIVDLKSGGQPMLSPDSKLGIVFNGEIYGFKQIKSKLSYPYQNQSDTEVILALYSKYGTKMTSKLPGMFAIAVWDEKNQQLFCSRDRFGEKPFYYAIGDHGEFLFASEIKAIIASGLITPIISKKALSLYLKYSFVPPTTTIYANIYTLPPAHTLVFSKGSISIQQYWQIPAVRSDISQPEAVSEFKRLMERSVCNQLVADVPIAAFLSGGLDSSTIVAVASQYVPRLKTISYAFQGTRNEAMYAREVARMYKTDHIELSESDIDLPALLSTMTRVYDEPYADSSNIPTYLIAQLTKQHSTVVLSGDGGDELFGGYRQWYSPLFYKQNHSFTWYEKIGLRAQAYLAAKLQSNDREWRYYQYQASCLTADETLLTLHHTQMSRFTDDQMSELGMEANFCSYSENTLEEVLADDVRFYMPGDILVKTDRAAMAHGLELRAPFLDQQLAEFILSLPASYKIAAMNDKVLLRHAYGDKWPASIRNRPKQGFGSPIRTWLSSLQPLLQEYLLSQTAPIKRILNTDAVERFAMEHNYQTWLLLQLSMWLETHPYETDY